MNVLSLPWVELAVLLPLAGAVAVRFVRDSGRAHILALASTAAAFAAAVLGWVALSVDEPPTRHILLWPKLEIDRLSAPLLAIVALLHLLTVLTTARVKLNRLSFTGHLAGESIRLAAFASLDPWPLILFLALAALPPAVELHRRQRPVRVYALHMLLFVALLVTGQWAADRQWAVGAVLLVLAVLVRSGTVPAHLWVADLFEHATFGTALLYVTPIAGMYAAMRLVLPIAPGWVLSSLAVLSLATALYAAAVALVQTEARRFFAYFFLSHASLILVGLELHTAITLAGSLALWLSVAVSLGGLGLVLRALEARFGRLTFDRHRGLYSTGPALAVGFALFGLGSVGFPGTMGFIATEVLLSGVVGSSTLIGLVMVLTAALNGISVLRVYFLLFTGSARPASAVTGATLRERVAIAVLLAISLGCGLLPQLFVTTHPWPGR